ncbi:MAG: AI-2E family transporter [Gemmatimonadota bacterium]|nr:MAG: AI-2E family transporter [Gemmatimonadota bacterium]
MNESKFRKTFLLLLLAAISFAFLAMVRSFLMTILLAAIFSGLAFPLYAWLERTFRGRRVLASLTTLLILLVVVVGPLLTVLGIVAGQAVRVSDTVTPWIQHQLSEPGLLAQRLDGLPFADRLEPYRSQIYTKAGEAVGRVGQFLFQSLSDTTKGTIAFLFQFFILLYTMFFFLLDGRRFLAKILYYLPLDDADEHRMVDKFVSVTRATLKGTLVIGIAQGTLAGVAFAVAGIQGAVFWGTIMTLLSVIPGIGTALVWGPAAIILVATGHTWTGILLAAWCGGVVGSIDNVLRPRLVGRDTEMHDLLILFGTMGGIFLFGVLGFIVGPILAALFVTIWEIYGIVFRDVLPDVTWIGDRPASATAPPPEDGA